jgi:predicted nucleic acid-binding protein
LSKFIVDAWAWIEYFRGTEYGAKLNDILEDSTADLYTCAITVAEIISKTARDNQDIEAAYNIVLSNSRIIKLDEQISRQAGLLHYRMRQTSKDFGIADAFILAAANKLEAKIITGDPHFKDLKNVIMIK